jgi:hypothetical protein
VASSPQHLPSEGPVRLSHLVPKTSLDGGDAALARSGSAGVFDMSALRENPTRLLKPLAARLPSLLLLVGDLARVKQTTRRRRRYVAMASSSSSAAATPPTDASSEETLSNVAAEELRAGDTVEFGVSRMSSVRVQDMQQLGYFGGRVARVPGTEVPKPEGELVVFEAFFAVGLRLPAHRFVGEVLRRFNV